MMGLKWSWVSKINGGDPEFIVEIGDEGTQEIGIVYVIPLFI